MTDRPDLPAGLPPDSDPAAPEPPPSVWVAGTETGDDKLKPVPPGKGDNFLTKVLQNRYLGWVGLAIAVVAPFIDGSNYAIGIMTNALIFVMLAVGLNIVVGYCGLLDLGFAAFYAIGAYVSGSVAKILSWPILATIPFVLAAAILAGVIIGGPTLRLRSDYLAIVTLGFGEIIRITANNVTVTHNDMPIIGGPSGIYGIPGLSFGGLDLSPITNPIGSYFATLVIVAIGVLIASRLGRGRLGRAWRFIREDEDAAEAMGIHTYTVKLAAYIAGAMFGGVAGILWGAKQTAVSPTDFTFLYSALILMAVVLGGMGSIPGVILGAIVISALPDLLTGAGAWRFVIFGVLLIVMMIFRPQGLWPHRAVERVRRRLRQPSGPGESGPYGTAEPESVTT
ncbi:MAG: branched-chain amino acid ABC transporter permease [Actinomycetota bacterium]|nr:branched-chain amino acid ABC transporter permease [Actinomycetota bacterium]